MKAPLEGEGGNAPEGPMIARTSPRLAVQETRERMHLFPSWWGSSGIG